MRLKQEVGSGVSLSQDLALGLSKWSVPSLELPTMHQDLGISQRALQQVT